MRTSISDERTATTITDERNSTFAHQIGVRVTRNLELTTLRNV